MTHLLAALLLLVQAQAPRKGDLPLQVPQGWEAKKQGGALMIVPKDLPAGTLYNVVVPELTHKLGSLKNLMAAAKATLDEVGAFKPAREPVAGKSNGDWDYEVVIGTLEKEGGRILAQAVVLRKGEEEGMILVVTDSLETLNKYSDAFTAMVRSVGAPKPAPPVAAAAAGKVDLKYKSPEGWASKASDGSVLLEKIMDAEDRRIFRILILPSQPLQGSLRKTFLDLWASLVAPTFDTAIVPLPLVRRMKSGMACAFDQDPRAKNKNGDQLNGGLYVLAQGTRCVPIMGFYYNLGTVKDVEKELEALFESAEIPGAGTEKVALVVPAEMAGSWSVSSYGMANYVNAATGAYAGDASIATGDSLTINKDGTYRQSGMAITGGRTIKEADEGKVTIDDTELILTGKERTRRYRIFGTGADPKAGTFLVLSTTSNTDEILNLAVPRRLFSGTWYKRKD